MRANKAEYDAVEAVMQKFADAIHEADHTIVEPYILKEALICGNGGGSFSIVPVEALLANIDTVGKEIGSKVEFRIDILALEETTAVCCVLEENMAGINYTNFFNLRKAEDGWKITVQQYNQSSDTSNAEMSAQFK